MKRKGKEPYMTEGNKERKPVKPVTVKIDDFRKKLNQAVADSELPPFLLEMVLGEMLSAHRIDCRNFRDYLCQYFFRLFCQI